MVVLVISDDMEKETIDAIGQIGKVIYKPANLSDALKDADALIVRSATKVTKELLESASGTKKLKLKVVARAGVGLDNVDVRACEERGITVINTPAASSNAVAELVIGTMICLLRNVQKAHLQMKTSVWGKKGLTGSEISGKTLGVIGFGRIGSLVAEKAGGLGMNIVAYDPKAKEMTQADGNSKTKDMRTKNVEFVPLGELLGSSDIVTIHVALNAETKNMIDAEALAKMKNGAYLINAARGGIVDENALYDACKSGKLTGAALDVYASEPYTGKLLELDNVLFTPHIGASTKEAQERIGKELVERLKKELE